MGAEKGSGGRRPVRGFITLSYYLNSEKQKYLKVEHGAVGHDRRNKAKIEKQGVIRLRRHKRRGT